ncbi:MAG: thiamine pyrophosphate-dependent enzyme, partial [bacterium]
AADTSCGMEKTSQNRTFGTNGDYYVNCEHSPARYDKVGEALGCFGAFVQTPDELEPALKMAMEANRPAVVHVVIDADANVNPPGADVWAATHSTK